MNLGKSGKKEKGPNEKYLEILEIANNASSFPLDYGGPHLTQCYELVVAGLLQGRHLKGNSGEVIHVVIFGITVEGRERLQQLRVEQQILPTKKEIFSGLKWFNKTFVTALITSIITAIVTILISHWFTGRAPSP